MKPMPDWERAQIEGQRSWVDAYGLVRSRAKFCLTTLTDFKHKCSRVGRKCNRFPEPDHTSYWETPGRSFHPRAYVTQPYPHWERYEDDARSLCASLGLRMTLFMPTNPRSPSWWNPGRTYFILVATSRLVRVRPKAIVAPAQEPSGETEAAKEPDGDADD